MYICVLGMSDAMMAGARVGRCASSAPSQVRGRLDALMAPMLVRVGADRTSTHCRVALPHVFFNVEQSDRRTLATFVSSRLRRGRDVLMLEHLGTRSRTRFVCQAAWGVGGVNTCSEFTFQFAFLCIFCTFVNTHLCVYVFTYLCISHMYIYICHLRAGLRRYALASKLKILSSIYIPTQPGIPCYLQSTGVNAGDLNRFSFSCLVPLVCAEGPDSLFTASV